MALTYDTRLGHKFEELVLSEVENLKEALSVGAMSEVEYRFACGRIRGLREAIEIYEEAISIINGAERS